MRLQRTWKCMVQYGGIIKRRSCLTNLLEFFEEVTTKFDKGEPVDVIYLDFQKAFEKVPHRRLLNKIRTHGVWGKVLAWIEGCLTGRRQRGGPDEVYKNNLRDEGLIIGGAVEDSGSVLYEVWKGKSNQANYCPINVLSFISKVMDGVFNSAIKLQLLSDATFGFSQGHKVPDLIAALVQSWTKELNSR
eukprot:g40284.t1